MRELELGPTIMHEGQAWSYVPGRLSFTFFIFRLDMGISANRSRNLTQPNSHQFIPN
jgi:hypothetical protein